MGRGNVFKHATPTSTEDLDITVDRGEEGVLVRLHGRVGLDSSPALRDSLLAILQGEPPKTVIVDLTEVPDIDLSGIATLIEGLKVARSHQTTLCVTGLQGRVVRLFEVTGLRGLFETSGCKSVSSKLKVN